MCVRSCGVFLVEAGWIIGYVAGQFVYLQNVIFMRRCACRVMCAFVRSCVRVCIGVRRRVCTRVHVNVFCACVCGFVGPSLW